MKYNIIGVNLFNDIVCSSDKEPPILNCCNIKNKLADGSALIGIVLLPIKLFCAPERSAVLPFFVNEGTSCILGKSAIDKLFPEYFDVNIAKESATINVTSSCVSAATFSYSYCCYCPGCL